MGKGASGCSEPMPSAGGGIQDWLHSLPEGAAVEWHEPSFSEDQQWASSWMDIYLSHDERSAPSALTVVGPGNQVEPGDLEMPYDSQMEISFQGQEVSKVTLKGPQGEIELDDIDLKRQVEESWNLVWRPRLTRQEGEDNRWSMGVWSRKAIEAMLEGLSGRKDISFSQLPAEPVDLEVDRERLYSIGDGLYATDQAMDQLLAMDPDQAAEVTARLRAQAEAEPYPPGQ